MNNFATDGDQVKKKYRNEWMDDENKIFINKLNNICNAYEGTTGDVRKFV